jgi:hypothetical protein
MKALEFMTEAELAELMTTCGKQLEVVCAVLGAEKPRFVLLLFNDPSVAQYISNCERQDVIKALREAADRFERQQVIPR